MNRCDRFLAATVEEGQSVAIGPILTWERFAIDNALLLLKILPDTSTLSTGCRWCQRISCEFVHSSLKLNQCFSVAFTSARVGNGFLAWWSNVSGNRRHEATEAVRMCAVELA